MIGIAASGVCLALLVALGLVERWHRDKARRRIPIRIHVNGTRGKSTVTRMIAGALREAGFPVMAKTTGTAPRVIHADGSERSVRRRGPASIREQLWFMRYAARGGARAVVVECMAIDPVLQWASEHDMVGATIGVITNTRSDHGDLMGTGREDVARALSSTIPTRGILVTGEIDARDWIASQAAALDSRVVDSTSEPLPGGAAHLKPWMKENARIVLAVTRRLGLDDRAAVRGMLAAVEDPGSVRTGSLSRDAGSSPFLDATAANDPESLASLLESEEASASRPRLFVFNHRADRPVRLAQFAASNVWSRPSDLVLVTGDRPDLMTMRRLPRRQGSAPAFVPSRRLSQALSATPGEWVVVFCGNTKGFDLNPLLREGS